eukprot:4419009-Amphidinium_carterae.1
MIAHILPEKLKEAILAADVGWVDDVEPQKCTIVDDSGDEKTLTVIHAYRISDGADPAVWVMTQEKHGCPLVSMSYGIPKMNGVDVPVICHGYDPGLGSVQASIGMDARFVTDTKGGVTIVNSGCRAPGWSGAAILTTEEGSDRMRLLGLQTPAEDSNRSGTGITEAEGSASSCAPRIP